MASTFQVPTRSRLSSHQSSPHDQREGLIREATRLLALAEAAAQRGDLAEAARTILQSLDCERRAGSTGPQVLQLIKPRN